ncbi:MAG: tetratricopeptide repeat protein [Saprospiraceae bacterium]
MDFYEYIEDYCNGFMEESTREAFEQAMVSDKALAAAVSNYMEGKKIAEGLLEIDMMETLNKLKTEKEKVGTIRSNIRERLNQPLWFATIAASFLLIIVLSVIFLQHSKNNQYTQLFEKYYFEPLSSESRGGQSESISQTDNPCQIAHIYLDMGKISKAKKLYSQLLEKGENCDQKANYFLSLVALQQGDMEMAKSHLMDIDLKSLDSLMNMRVKQLKIELEGK